MNQIINKFLLVGDKFMPEMHLRQHAFIHYLFTRNKERKKDLNVQVLIYCIEML